MKYRQVGALGYQVSQLGFGAMRFPMTQNKEVDYDRAVPILRRALDLGVNIIDSHPQYCEGHSETIIGKAIQGYDRSKIYISTKNTLYTELGPGETHRSRLEKSLERLQTDYIDFYLVHALVMDVFRQKGTAFLKEMRKAKQDGLIRHIGFSSHDLPKNVIKFIETGQFECMLVQYNLIDHHWTDALKCAHENGLGTMVMGPLSGGRLVRPNEISQLMGAENDTKSVEICLRYVWNNENVDVAFSGMRSVEEVEQNVRILSKDTELNPDEVKEAEKMADEKQRLSDLYCTGCNYCMPCPQKVSIPGVFYQRNLYAVYHLEDYAREAYNRMIGYNTSAENCIECGECEKKCPQHIPIIEQLKESHFLFTRWKKSAAKRKKTCCS